MQSDGGNPTSKESIKDLSVENTQNIDKKANNIKRKSVNKIKFEDGFKKLISDNKKNNSEPTNPTEKIIEINEPPLHANNSTREISDETNIGSPIKSQEPHPTESIDDIKSWVKRTSLKWRSGLEKIDSNSNAPSGDVSASLGISKTPTNENPAGDNSAVNQTMLKDSSREISISSSPSSSHNPTSSIKKDTSPLEQADASHRGLAYVPSIAYDVLVQRNVNKDYEGLIFTDLERHLSDEDFTQIFKKSRVIK